MSAVDARPETELADALWRAAATAMYGAAHGPATSRKARLATAAVLRELATESRRAESNAHEWLSGLATAVTTGEDR